MALLCEFLFFFGALRLLEPSGLILPLTAATAVLSHSRSISPRASRKRLRCSQPKTSTSQQCVDGGSIEEMKNARLSRLGMLLYRAANWSVPGELLVFRLAGGGSSESRYSR